MFAIYIRGSFNKFPDFLVQAFKIVVYSWKFSMLLLYILLNDWPIFMISASKEHLQQQLEYTLQKPDCHSWWLSNMQSGREDTFEEQYTIQFCVLNLEKMPQKRTECFRLLFDHLAWIKHQFLSGIRDSRKAGSLWGMLRGVGGVRKSIHLSWLAKRDRGYYVEVLREFRKRFLGKRPTLFKSAQWHFHQDNAPVHNTILFTDYLTKMVIKTVRHPPYSPDVAPCDFWSFPKLRVYRYDINWGDERGCDESHWDAQTRGLPWEFAEVVGTVQQLHCKPEEITSKGTRVSCGVLSITMPIRKKSGNLFNDPLTYTV